MPFAPSDPGTFKIPGEDIPYWDGGHYGGAGNGGQGPFNPGVFDPSSFGGGGSGFAFGSRYPNFQGFGGVDSRRRGLQGQAGPNMMLPSSAASWAPQAFAQSQTRGSNPPPAGGSGGGGSYWDLLMGRFGGTPDQPWSHAAGTDAEALGDQILGGNGQGWASPFGDPRVMAAYDQDARRRGLDMEQSAVLGAKIDGADPWTQSLSRTLARGNAQHSAADFYNQNRLNASQNYNDLIRYLYQHKLGEYDAFKANEWNRANADHDASRANKAGIWQTLGGLAGAGIGAWTGKGK